MLVGGWALYRAGRRETVALAGPGEALATAG